MENQNGNQVRISFLRQLDIFDPGTFYQTCHIVGVGAVGSRVAENLARLGIKKIELYDHDVVQSHNVPTGAFNPGQIGIPKVQAMKEQLSSFNETRVIAHCQMIEGQTSFQGIVFLCVDSMEARQRIWQSSIKQKLFIPLMIEIRIGAQEGRIYTVNPLALEEIKNWEAVSNYSDDDAQEVPCTYRSIISTVATVVGYAVNQVILWHAGFPYPNSIILGLKGLPLLRADRWT